MAWTRRSSAAWTAGFYPGLLWQAYDWTRDPAWLRRARTWSAGVRPQATNTGTHDLGFVIGTTAGRGASLDPSPSARTSYARTVVTTARSLATRWNPTVGAVESGRYDGQWGVIIDSAMNMQLLFHAARLTDDPAEAESFRSIAHQHLRTLARDFVRADGSTVHRIGYDPVGGERLAVLAGQGHSASSTWSRGQAWALYGFTMGYRETRDDGLLDAARRVAGFWLTRGAADCVPRWDFDAPAELPQRDSSAAAIAAAGLLDLAGLDPDRGLRAAYRSDSLSMLTALTARAYTTEGSAHPAILRRQSYSVPEAAREGSYIWGDHYLMEALTKALRVLRVTPRLAVAAPATASYAEPVTVVVRAALPGGAPAGAVPVNVAWRREGSVAWAPIASGVTGSAGTARLSFPAVAAGRLRAASDSVDRPDGPVGGYDVARSASRGLAVTVSGELRVAARRTGGYILTIPRIAAPPGTHLALQERRDARWVTVRMVSSTPATSTRLRRTVARYFRVLPVVPRGFRSVPSAVTRVPAR